MDPDQPAINRRSTRHRLTRLGVQVMLIGVFGVLGGSLNGLNLLVVVAAVTLSAILVQWRLSRAMIDSLRIDRRMPVEAFAGKPVRIRYQLGNEHPLLPMWLIRVEDVLQRIGSGDATGTRSAGTRSAGTRSTGTRSTGDGDASVSRTSRWTAMAKRSDAAGGIAQPTLTGVGLLLPGQKTSAFFDVTANHRGRYRMGRWFVSTTAPLSLSMAYRTSIREEDFLEVYPRMLRLQSSWQRMLPSRLGNVSATSHRRGPSDDVFFGLREYRHGDSPRHIHWRTTARLGQPAVRQFEQQRRYDLCLLVDAWSESVTPESSSASSSKWRSSKNASASSSGLWDRWIQTIRSFPSRIEGAANTNDLGMDEVVERAISLAATIAVELSQGNDSRLLLAVAGERFEVLTGGTSPMGLRRMLQSLASVQAGSHPEIDKALSQAATAVKRLPDLLVVSSRSQSRAIAADAATAVAIRQWKNSGQVNWVDVSSKDINRWVMMPETTA